MSFSFNPPFYLRNAHVQTILNSQGPRKLRAWMVRRKLRSRILTLEADDGTRLLAEHDCPSNRRAVLVILIHGWEGSSRSSYLLTTTSRLLSQGFDVLRVNLRDHGGSHHLNRELFNSTRSPEVASALLNYIAQQDYQQTIIGGFSLGGSFALRIAADRGIEMNLRMVFAICPPIDPARAMEALNRGPRTYEQYFFRKWRDSLQRKLQCFPDLDYAAELASARSLDDLNRLFIPRHTVYDKLEDYFAAYAITGDRLAAMSMPAYLIATEDDPIIPVDDVARIDPNDFLQVETHRYGGHCGYIENLAAKSWIERRIADLALAHA